MPYSRRWLSERHKSNIFDFFNQPSERVKSVSELSRSSLYRILITSKTGPSGTSPAEAALCDKSAVMGELLQNWNVDHFISPFVKNIGESVLISNL